MSPSQPAPEGERLGASDVLGVAFTVGDLILILTKLKMGAPILTTGAPAVGIAIHYHSFVDPTNDYVSFTGRKQPHED